MIHGSRAVDVLAVAALVLAVASTLFLVLLVARRLVLARATRRRLALEERLRPFALQLLDEDDDPPPLALRPDEAAQFAAMLARLGRRVRGASSARLRDWFEASGARGHATARLRARQPWRRAAAAFALGDMGSPGAAGDLVAALDDPDARVRAAAARGLGRLAVTDAVEPLLAAGADGRIPRLVAGQALLDIGPSALPQLLELARSGDDRERASAVELVGLIGGAVDAEPLVDALHDPAATVRASAARALGRLGADEAAARLRERLDDRIPFVRAAAADALGEIGDDEAAEQLHALARGDEFDAARAAAGALARIDPARVRRGGSEHLDEAADLLAL